MQRARYVVSAKKVYFDNSYFRSLFSSLLLFDSCCFQIECASRFLEASVFVCLFLQKGNITIGILCLHFFFHMQRTAPN